MAKSGRARTRPVEGDYVEFDPRDWQDFAAFCGEQFLRMDGDRAVVMSRGAPGPDGRRVPRAAVHVIAGTKAVKIDGAGGVACVAPDNFDDDGPWEAVPAGGDAGRDGWHTIPAVTGPGTVLRLADPGPFIAAAGEQYDGTEADGRVWILAGDGSRQLAGEGWVAVTPAGGGKVVFATPGRARPA